MPLTLIAMEAAGYRDHWIEYGGLEEVHDYSNINLSIKYTILIFLLTCDDYISREYQKES